MICSMCKEEVSLINWGTHKLEHEVDRLIRELNDERAINMDPRVPDAHWMDEDGKEYTLKWDYGDPSVGIQPGYVCDELDALYEEVKFLRAAREAEEGGGMNLPPWSDELTAEMERVHGPYADYLAWESWMDKTADMPCMAGCKDDCVFCRIYVFWEGLDGLDRGNLYGAMCKSLTHAGKEG